MVRSRGLAARRRDGRPLEDTILAVSARDMEARAKPGGGRRRETLALRVYRTQQKRRLAEIAERARDAEWQRQQDEADRQLREQVIERGEKPRRRRVEPPRPLTPPPPPPPAPLREPGVAEVVLVMADGERRVIDRMRAPELLKLMHRNGRISADQARRATIEAISFGRESRRIGV